MAEVRLEAKSGGSLEKLETELRDVERQLDDIRAAVVALSGKPLDLPTDPAEADLKRLVAELARLEARFKSAQQSVSFQQARNELEGTTASARRLANAEAALAARGKELIDFSRRLPPELRQSAEGMDRLERQTEQAAAAFREFERARPKAAGIGSLVSALNSLRGILGGVVAALGIQQILRFGRALIELGAEAVAVKVKFDRLLPSVRAFTGSTEVAEAVLGRLEDTSRRLQVPLADLVQPFIKTAAAVKETNLSTEELTDLFESALLSLRAFGGGASDAQRLINGLAQVAGKGSLQMEELRQQIGEVAFNALPSLAKALGTDVETLIKRVTDGSIDAETALRGFAKGLREANEAAGLAQLDTLAGDLGELERVSENARAALADGLEPGLRSLIQTFAELIEANEDTAETLGEFASAGLEGLAALVDKLAEARDGYRAFGEEIRQLALDTPAGKLRQELLEIANVLDPVRDEVELLFKNIERFARLAATGVDQSAEDIVESFKKSFREQAEAAGLAAEDIEATERTLAARLGEIFEATAFQRAEFEKAIRAEYEATGEINEASARQASEAITRFEREAIEARKELLRELVAETERNAAARVAREAEAAAEISAFLDGVVAKARATGEERAAADAEVATTLEEIERDLQEKLQKLRDEAAEKLKKPKVDRAEIARELTEKIVEAERDAAEKIRAEQERIAEEAEKAAERRIKAEEKVRADLEKSIEVYQKIVAAIQEISSEDGGDGEGAGEKQAKGFAKIADDVEELDGFLKGLIVSLDELNASLGTTDPGAILADSFGHAMDVLGEGAALLDERFGAGGVFDTISQGAQEAGGSFRDELVEQIRAGAGALEGLQGSARAMVEGVLRDFLSLAEGGQVTRADLEDFASSLSAAFRDAGVAVGDPIEEIRQQLDSLGDAQEAAGEKAEAAGEKQKNALDGVAPAADEAADSVSQLGDEWEQVGEGFERGGQRIERGADGLITISNAAKEAAPPLDQVATAAERIPETIVAEGQPQQLRDLGAAAGEATPQVQPLAEPVSLIAQGLASMVESLPVVAEQVPEIAAALPELQAGLEALLTLLSDNPLDLEGAAAQLTTIGASLETIQTSITTLSESLPGVQAALDPLLAAALEAADDDRLGRIAGALERAAQTAPQLPEPIERLAKGLKAISEGREDTVKAIDETRAALENLSRDELQDQLIRLVDTLGKVREKTDELAGDAEKIRVELETIERVIPDVVNRLGQLADELNGKLFPALVDSRDAAASLVEQLRALPEAAQEAAAGLQVIEDVGVPAIEAVNAVLDQMIQKLRTAREEAAALAAELANVSVP